MKIWLARMVAIVVVLSLTSFFIACEDKVTEVTKVNEVVGIQMIESGESLPECVADNAGAIVFLEDSAMVYYCSYGKWAVFNGADGATGPKGPKGDVGEKGDDGEAGSPGEKGDKGDTGDVGIQGEKGDCGDDGDPGKKGNQGDKGDIGDQGAKGETGNLDISTEPETSCSVQALQDGSGYKVICGEDSVGVLLHGKDGMNLGSSSSVSSSSSGPDSSYYDAENNSLTDLRDGQTYRTVTINSQVWMAQNLNYRYHLRTKNGGKADTSSFCYKNRVNAYCGKYGRLYYWSAAMDSAALFSTDGKGCGQDVKCTTAEVVRGVCPKGWHLPNKDEMKRLIDIAGGESKAAIKLKSVDDWLEDENNSGTDEYGFAMLPAGDYCGNGYTNLHHYGFLWTSSEKNQDHGYHLWLWYFKAEAELGPFNKYCAFSVRCIKN